MASRGEIPTSSSFSDNSLIGQTVEGVVEGSFGSGYFVTFRVQDTGRVLRGFIFNPGKPLPFSNIARRQAGTSASDLNEEHVYSQQQIANPTEQEPYTTEPLRPYIDLNEPVFSPLHLIPTPSGTVLNDEEPIPNSGDHHES